MRTHNSRSRRGAIAPMTALCLIGMLGFIALVVDLGLIMIMRNQCQNAADAAAMAGARTLTGDSATNNNYNNVAPEAQTAAAANSILGVPINTSTQLTLNIGDYYYNTSASSFQIDATGLGQTGDNYTLVQATVTSTQPSYFAQVFGISSLSASATSTAAHRPRDIVIVIDFSGSMRFESLLAYPYFGSRTNSMNASTAYPTWGAYSGNSSKLTYSTDLQASSGEIISEANTEVATTNAPTPVINGFYGDTTAFGTSTPAFTAASSTYGTTPGGDVPLTLSKNNSTTYAKNVSEFLYGSGSANVNRDWRFELDGYSAYSAGVANTNTSTATDYTNAPFNGYTQGPGYWGKSFMLWPPDPRVPLTTTYYTSTANNYSSPGQIEQLVLQFLMDFGYTAADFSNTSNTTYGALLNTSATKLTVPSSDAANFPTGTIKIMVGNVSGSAFTGSPEVLAVTASGTATSGTLPWTVSRAQDSTTAISSATTTPSASFTASATSIHVSSTTGFPSSAPFYIMVGTQTGSGTSSAVLTTPELMKVTALSGTTWTVSRAQHGTTATAGTTTMTVALAYTVGLETAPPLYGIFHTSSASNVPATVGKLPSGSNAWTSWTSSTLATYLTTSVYDPGGADLTQTTDTQYLQLLRLLARNGGNGMPKNSSGTAMPCDWRARFFTYTSSGGPVMDTDTTLYSSGTMNVPSSSGYTINYAAVLDWIKNCGTNPFPNQLRAGGVVYYTSIPSTINTGNFPPNDPNQRFWKEYIDAVLGFQQTSGTGTSASYSDTSSTMGYGSDFSWGTVSTSGQPSGWPGVSSPTSYSSTAPTYTTYTDNPKRPLLRGWFGPLTLVDYIGNYNQSDPDNNNSPRLWWPGTVTETPTYQTKLGVQAALADALKNHPNDNISLVFFSSPRSSATATGYYNYARVPLGRNQRLMVNSLWFSPKVITNNAEISLFDSSGNQSGDIYDVPRANGGTCYSMALMLAYNQFSNNSALQTFTANAATGTAGGLGRNGAAKLLVFETDGMVNTGASGTLVTSTTGSGYYKVRIADANNYAASGTEFPSNVTGVTFSTGATQAQNLCTQIAALQSAGGYSTTTKPVKIHCIAFGSLFESSNSSTNKTNALQNLAQMEVIGNVQTSGATTLASNKIIVGDYATRIANVQSAFTSIMEDGIQVTLISSGTNQP